MIKRTKLLSQSLICLGLNAFLSSPAFSQTTQPEPDNNLDNLLCKDVMIMAGIDRDTTIAFMHGYLTHKRGDKVVDVERVEGSTVIFLEDCIDAPTAKALDTLEKALGN